MKHTVSPLRSTVPPKLQSTAPNLSWWSATAEEWEHAELDPKAMAPVRTAEARLAAADAERAAALEQANATLRGIRLAIARGERTFTDAAPEHANATALADLADPSMRRRVALTLAGDLTAAMRKVGDQLVVKALAPAYAAVIAEATELAPLVAEITEERDAMRAPSASRDAWARLITLEARHRDLHTVARRLRHNHITTVSRHEAFDAEYEFRNPERVTRAGGVLGLLSLIASGADPYIGTAAEVDALEDARDESLRVTPKPTPLVRRDGSLTGGTAA